MAADKSSGFWGSAEFGPGDDDNLTIDLDTLMDLIEEVPGQPNQVGILSRSRCLPGGCGLSFPIWRGRVPDLQLGRQNLELEMFYVNYVCRCF